MARVIWTLPALDDVDEIKDFISASFEKYAKNEVKKIFETVDQLLEFPLSGKVVSIKFNPHIRQAISGNYKIIYRILEADVIEIITVIHGSRQIDIDKLVFEPEIEYKKQE